MCNLVEKLLIFANARNCTSGAWLMGFGGDEVLEVNPPLSRSRNASKAALFGANQLTREPMLPTTLDTPE